ncbi:ferredoxin hydrogenase small subunit [Rhodopseudomonas rhenobacensis]|uniref:hydrogenase (acceptor) n=1 Tax=Rhodopseudomonas rhenobacensis TaxID=87461 RepID=A0A7W8DYX8_9BRAD|nr:HupU protein [Rhodopseudomonas rhenobacensis]MBB5047300.1 ferredoxin hydrogenase small subunit [Rhodopseudomonas rhenobacensis]
MGPINLLWLQAAGCGGCTMAILEQGRAGWFAELASFGINLLWHPSVSEATADEVTDLLADVAAERTALSILVVEGAVLRGPNGSGRFNMLGGTGRSMASWIGELAPRADYVVAVGSCSAYGGVPAAGHNPTDASGLQFLGTEPGGVLGAAFRSKAGLPVINIAGCAPHPGWIAETLAALALGDFSDSALDSFARPKFFAEHLAHHGCARNEFYEFKASAEAMSQRGCLMEHLGCKATQAVGDCNQRAWNGGGSCTQGGYPCIACTSPGFEAASNYMTTAKVAGIPVGLPLDMPKAWFVALAALSKSATPKRVRANANADHVVVPPTPSGQRRK